MTMRVFIECPECLSKNTCLFSVKPMLLLLCRDCSELITINENGDPVCVDDGEIESSETIFDSGL